MKTKILLLMIFIFSFSIVHAQEGKENTSFVRFTIDKGLFGLLSDDQQQTIKRQIQALDDFAENSIRASLPRSIQKKIENLKIKIQLTNLPGRDGLFSPSDSGDEHTISIQLIQLTSNGVNALLAHEIYHAIHFHINPDEYAWMREGMAQYFEFMTTGNFNGSNISAARANPMTPLLADYDIDQTERAQYGHNLLYITYLMNRCGGKNLFWKLTEGNLAREKGSYLIDSVLKEMDSSLEECSDFASSAIIFQVAKMHNQIQYLNPKEKNKFYVSPTNITPALKTIDTEKELEFFIREMPSLSSYKMPMDKFKKLKGKCSQCEIFYATSVFPFTVSQTAPDKTKDVTVILVKTSQK